MPIIKCQHCNAEMESTKKINRNGKLQILGVVLALCSIGLLFAFPFGTIIGILLLIVSARMGYSEKKVWLCCECGYFYERA